MSNHYTYMYFVPHKTNTRPTYNPETFSFICHYGSRNTRVRADGRFAAREKAAAYFKTSPDKIIAVRA